MEKVYFIIALLLTSFAGYGQTATGMKGVRYGSDVSVRDGQVKVEVTIDPRNLHLGTQEMMIFTPVMLSAGQEQQLDFAPIVLAGGKRMKSIRRQLHYGRTPFPVEAEFIRKHTKKNAGPFTQTYNLAFEEWMPGSEIMIFTEIAGCEGCGRQTDSIVLASVPVPEFRVTYIVPQAQTKSRSEKYAARLNFLVDKWELLVHYKDNSRVLAEADRVISRILNNPDIKVTRCVVNGYASPEGSYERNVILADNRAAALVNYLKQKYNRSTGMVISKGHAEDWNGLRESVANGPYFEGRDKVLDIIDNTPNIELRKQKLGSLAGGVIYRQLLNTVYPALRRDELEIDYEIRPYSAEEVKEIFTSRPTMLNENEMFFLAQSYPVGSREFKEIFDTAIKLFPQSEISKINSAAVEIEYRAEAIATERLEGINTPEAWNNRGVAHALMGKKDLAAECFRRATKEGEINAEHNLKQLGITIQQDN